MFGEPRDLKIKIEWERNWRITTAGKISTSEVKVKRKGDGMRANDFVESYMDFNYYALSRNRLRLCCCSSSPIKSFLQFRAHERVNERIEEFLLSLKI